MAQRPFSFAITFVALFALVFGFMAMTDTLPDSISQNSTGKTNQTNGGTSDVPGTSDVQGAEAPTRIVAKNIGLDVAVVNPTATKVELLDEALKQGAVRYPDSALLNVDGTVLLFGHSSYLPITRPFYQTFNGIQNLKAGQMVSVYSGATEYRYTVVGVRVANAEEDVIELPTTGKHLVLVTCNSFATKSARYVVNADFVGAYGL